MTSKKSGRMKSSVDPSVLAPLGLLVVNFNLIEEMLSFTIWSLLGCEQRLGMCATTQLSFRGLINAFCSLYYLRAIDDPDTVASVQSLRVRLEAVEQKRNELLHSQWMVGMKPGLSGRSKASAKAKKGLVIRYVDVSAADITAVADEMGALSGEVLNLYFAFWEKHGGLQEVMLKAMPEDEARELLPELSQE